MKKSYLFLFAIVVLVFTVSCSTPPAPQPPVNEEPPINTAGPELRVTFSPRYFSPDEDTLSIYLSAISEAPLVSWKVEIRESQSSSQLFYEWEGHGKPPEMLNWNGKSSKGELVQSASDYPLVFTATNIYGNSSRIESRIEVDVFVIREGSNLWIQIPSVIFTPNVGTWDDLDANTIESNERILRRIAQILNKFGDYKVNIEGHANHTVNPANRARYQAEQAEELQPLSELRAKRVLDGLVMLGIDPKRLSFHGIGGLRPIVPWEDKDNWWKNRRVEFILIK